MENLRDAIRSVILTTIVGFVVWVAAYTATGIAMAIAGISFSRNMHFAYSIVVAICLAFIAAVYHHEATRK